MMKPLSLPTNPGMPNVLPLKKSAKNRSKTVWFFVINIF